MSLEAFDIGLKKKAKNSDINIILEKYMNSAEKIRNFMSVFSPAMGYITQML